MAPLLKVLSPRTNNLKNNLNVTTKNSRYGVNFSKIVACQRTTLFKDAMKACFY